MSVEALLTRLIESLDRNSAAMEALNKKAGGSAPASEKSTSKAETKPASKAKSLTVDDIAEAFGGYLKGGDADARAEAKENVKAILSHFGVERASHIEPENFSEALRYLDQFKAGKTPDFMNEEGGDDDGDDGDGDDDLM